MKPVYPSEQPQKSGSRGSGTLHLNFESDGATPGPTRIGGGKIGTKMGTATVFQIGTVNCGRTNLSISLESSRKGGLGDHKGRPYTIRKDSRTFGGSPFRVTRSRRGAGAPLLLFKTGVAKQSFAFRHSEECPTTRRGDLYGRPLVGQLLK